MYIIYHIYYPNQHPDILWESKPQSLHATHWGQNPTTLGYQTGYQEGCGLYYKNQGSCSKNKRSISPGFDTHRDLQELYSDTSRNKKKG